MEHSHENQKCMSQSTGLAVHMTLKIFTHEVDNPAEVGGIVFGASRFCLAVLDNVVRSLLFSLAASFFKSSTVFPARNYKIVQ